MAMTRSFNRAFRSPSIRTGILILLLLSMSTWPARSRGQAPAAPAKPEAVDPQLQLIGSLASSHVYTTFGYIGVVADNTENALYTPQKIDELMREVTLISDPLTTQLEALRKTDLTPDDAQTVQQIIEIYALLRQESDALRVYAKERTKANGSEFHRLRAEAWTGVAKLLNIPSGQTPAP